MELETVVVVVEEAVILGRGMVAVGTGKVAVGAMVAVERAWEVTSRESSCQIQRETVKVRSILTRSTMVQLRRAPKCPQVWSMNCPQSQNLTVEQDEQSLLFHCRSPLPPTRCSPPSKRKGRTFHPRPSLEELQNGTAAERVTRGNHRKRGRRQQRGALARCRRGGACCSTRPAASSARSSHPPRRRLAHQSRS